MIQRLQSIYLFLAFAAAVAVFFFPLAVFTAPDFQCVLKVTGLKYISGDQQPLSVNTVLLMVLLGGTAVMAAVSVFLYKNRMTQLKLVKITMIVAIVFIVLIFVFSEKLIAGKIPGMDPVAYREGSYISLVMVVLLILASRRINSDEKKIRAADRIR